MCIVVGIIFLFDVEKIVTNARLPTWCYTRDHTLYFAGSIHSRVHACVRVRIYIPSALARGRSAARDT